MLNGSWVGVAKPAKTNIRKIATRRQERSFVEETIPARFSRIRTSGNSNETPKMTSIDMTNEMYWLTSSSDTTPLPAKPSSTSSAGPSTRYEMTVPAANSTIDESTNATPHRRSLRCSPGVMKAQIWYSQIGHDTTMPATSETLSRMKKASVGCVKIRSQPAPPVRLLAGTSQYGCRRTSKTAR